MDNGDSSLDLSGTIGCFSSCFGGGSSFNPQGQNPFSNPSNPFENNRPNANPLAAYGASNSKVSSNPFGNSSNSNQNNDEDLDIDAMMKKIDERIKELEAEEEKEKQAEENEAKASEQKTVEEINNPVNNEVSDNKPLSSSSVIMPSDKIDFTSFEKPKENNDIKTNDSNSNEDIFDDMIEDLSFDDEVDVNQNENKPNEVNENLNSSTNVNTDEKKEDNTSTVYKNESEINKIMNEKDDKNDDDDFFDEFFE